MKFLTVPSIISCYYYLLIVDTSPLLILFLNIDGAILLFVSFDYVSIYYEYLLSVSVEFVNEVLVSYNILFFLT